MGLATKRRDYCDIEKDSIGLLMNNIMEKKGVDETLLKFEKLLDDIIKDKISFDKFIYSKSLRKDYANRSRIMHAVLADRMGERDPGNKPRANDRVQFSYIKTGFKWGKELKGEIIENIDYIKENNLALNKHEFLEKIFKAVEPVLELLITRKKDIVLFKRKWEDRLDCYENGW